MFRTPRPLTIEDFRKDLDNQKRKLRALPASQRGPLFFSDEILKDIPEQEQEMLLKLCTEMLDTSDEALDDDDSISALIADMDEASREKFVETHPQFKSLFEQHVDRIKTAMG